MIRRLAAFLAACFFVIPAACLAQDTNSSTSAGWRKHPNNPVLGGKYGTCFDLAALKDGDVYRMWFSWHAARAASVACVESKDGIHWSEPVIALSPNKASGWEDDINRPVVVKQDGMYRM